MDEQELDRKREAALLRERTRQLRGLLGGGLLVLVILLFRARGLHVFHAGWWRL